MKEKILNDPPIKRNIHDNKNNGNNENLILNQNKKNKVNNLARENIIATFDNYKASEENRINNEKQNYNKENLIKREGNYYTFIIYSYPKKVRHNYLIEEE